MVKRFLKAAAPLATLVCAAMTPNRGSIAATSYTAGYSALATRIPAFARKYGLRCSACHTAWPELNAFGQRFKDNGYQLGNDRDSPIWQAPAYWPIAMRTTPQLHLESTTHQVTDAAPAGKTRGQTRFALFRGGFLFRWSPPKKIPFGLLPTPSAQRPPGPLG